MSRDAARFPQTPWSVVLAAGQQSSPRSDEVLAKLCQAYWQPLYFYLRRSGHPSHDAQDAVQSCFLHLLEKHSLAHVHPARGRFRSFLLASLRNCLADEQRKQRAQKRGGAVELVSLDVETAEGLIAREPVDERQDPEKLFERRWALTLLDRVLVRLKEEYAARKEVRKERGHPLA